MEMEDLKTADGIIQATKRREGLTDAQKFAAIVMLRMLLPAPAEGQFKSFKVHPNQGRGQRASEFGITPQMLVDFYDMVKDGNHRRRVTKQEMEEIVRVDFKGYKGVNPSDVSARFLGNNCYSKLELHCFEQTLPIYLGSLFPAFYEKVKVEYERKMGKSVFQYETVPVPKGKEREVAQDTLDFSRPLPSANSHFVFATATSEEDPGLQAALQASLREQQRGDGQPGPSRASREEDDEFQGEIEIPEEILYPDLIDFASESRSSGFKSDPSPAAEVVIEILSSSKSSTGVEEDDDLPLQQKNNEQLSTGHNSSLAEMTTLMNASSALSQQFMASLSGPQKDMYNKLRKTEAHEKFVLEKIIEYNTAQLFREVLVNTVLESWAHLMEAVDGASLSEENRTSMRAVLESKGTNILESYLPALVKYKLRKGGEQQ